MYEHIVNYLMNSTNFPRVIAYGLEGFFFFIYIGFALRTLAKRNNIPHAWMAFVPVIQGYLFVKIAKCSGGWFWILFILCGAAIEVDRQVYPWAVLWVSLGFIASYFYLWACLARSIGRSWFWGLLMMVPLLNVVVLGFLAWTMPRHQSTSMILPADKGRVS